MKKILNNIMSALYNITQNKAYTLFCVIGTAITFVFIIIMLQLMYTLVGNVPPFVNADRTIVFEDFKDVQGRKIGGIQADEVPLFVKQIKGLKNYFISYNTVDNISVHDNYKSVSLVFVNSDYWQINKFDFIEGRPFTEQDCLEKKTLIVIKENIAKTFFKGDNAIGKKMEIQGITYTVIGVVRDYSTFAIRTGGIWIPYVFNKFVPRGLRYYDFGIWVPQGIDVQNMKEQVSTAILSYWNNRKEKVDISPDKLLTFQEKRINKLGNDFYSYGIPIAIVLLLIIPAINIVTLNIANVNNYTKEIALKRALGARIMDSFMQMITEIFILVIIGTLLGICLTFPVANWFSSLFFDKGVGGEVALIEYLDYRVILCGVFPLALAFTLLSGGIPAYIVAKKNIAETLKGGSR